MRKHVLKEVIDNFSPELRNAEIFKNGFSLSFLRRGSYHAMKLVKYLNLSESYEDFKYAYENIHDYSSFIKILRKK